MHSLQEYAEKQRLNKEKKREERESMVRGDDGEDDGEDGDEDDELDEVEEEEGGGGEGGGAEMNTRRRPTSAAASFGGGAGAGGGGESAGGGAGAGGGGESAGAAADLPLPLRVLRDAAMAHAEQWRQQRQQEHQPVGTAANAMSTAAAGGSNDSSAESIIVPSLFSLTKAFIRTHAEDLPVLPQRGLPDFLLQEVLRTDEAVGPEVIADFVARIALQKGEADEDGNGDKSSDRVTISTVHRAKGLEWKAVFVPFFNEGVMPCVFRNNKDKDDEDIESGDGGGASSDLERHRSGCPVHKSTTGVCDGRCARHFEKEAERNGQGTEEQRHADEERRLAHVAATRARDWLFFSHVDCMGSGHTATSHERSSFEEALGSASHAIHREDKRSSEQKKKAKKLAERPVRQGYGR
jgi:hypothetical protein